MEDIHRNGLRSSLGALFESGEYSDLIVCTSRKEYKVHKAVICSRSRVFAAACKGDFQESINNRIELDYYDPDAVERMLVYLYTLDYDDGTSSCLEEADLGLEEYTKESERQTVEVPQSASDIKRNDDTEVAHASATVEVSNDELVLAQSGLLNNALVYDIADKYDIAELKELARIKFLSHGGSLISSSEFPEIIKMVYNSTPCNDRGLRDIVSSICAKDARKLKGNQVFKSIIGETGDFAFDLLCEVLGQDDKRLEQMAEDLAKFKDENKISRVDMRNLEREKKRDSDKLQAVIDIVNRLEACANCGVDFTARLGTKNSGMVTCAKCSWVH